MENLGHLNNCSWLHVWNGNELVWVPEPTIAEVFNMVQALRDAKDCLEALSIEYGHGSGAYTKDIDGILARIDGAVA